MTVPVAAPWPRIPYGEASFRRIRVNGWLYVDKTRFLRPLEEERYVFFIRPRRFGKSCWLSLLECCYGRHWAHELEALFGGTAVGRAPTAERGRYVIVRFDFSAFDDKLETLEERFEGYCFIELRHALERHPDLFPEAALRRILAPPAIDGRLRELFKYAGERGIPLYILIDEYDHFANTVLAHRGREACESFTHGGGFYRNFFATLEAGTGEAGGLGLMYGYLRDAYRDVGVFSVSHYHFSRLVRAMACRGEWRPAVEYIATALAGQTGIRDYLDGEKVVQAFLAAHFSVVALRHPQRAGAEQGLRGPLPGALRGAVPGHRVRVRRRGEVPEAGRAGG